MKCAFVILVVSFMCLFCCTVSAVDTNEIYSEQFEQSNAEELENALPDDVAENIKDLDFSIDDYNSAQNISAGNIFKQIWTFLKSGGKRPFLSGSAVLGVLLLSAVVGDIFTENRMVQYVTALSLSAVAVMPIVTVISDTVSAIKAAGVFMLSFVPIFAGVLI